MADSDLHVATTELGAEERRAELAQARRLAERYRLEFVDMDNFRIDQDLFRSIPADLMLRYGFVPYRREVKTLVIVVSDPSDLPMIDELGVLLATPIKVTVGARSAIESIAVRGPTTTLIGVPSRTPSSSIIGRSVGSETTISSALPARRYGTNP